MGKTGFSSGWPGCSEGFSSGFDLGKSLRAALPALEKPRSSLLFYLYYTIFSVRVPEQLKIPLGRGALPCSYLLCTFKVQQIFLTVAIHVIFIVLISFCGIISLSYACFVRLFMFTLASFKTDSSTSN